MDGSVRQNKRVRKVEDSTDVPPPEIEALEELVVEPEVDGFVGTFGAVVEMVDRRSLWAWIDQACAIAKMLANEGVASCYGMLLEADERLR